MRKSGSKLVKILIASKDIGKGLFEQPSAAKVKTSASKATSAYGLRGTREVEFSDHIRAFRERDSSKP
jgi:hypothetical protein